MGENISPFLVDKKKILMLYCLKNDCADVSSILNNH